MIRSIQIAARVIFATTALATPALAALGGGDVRMSGSGDDVTIERRGPTPSQVGRRTMFAGSSGDGIEVMTVGPLPPAAQPGRSLTLQGSRDDATVVEAAPRG